MPDLWLPNGAAESILNDNAEEEAERIVAFTRRLKALDVRLGMFMCNEDDAENELQAGFYYVHRHNEDGTVSFWEIRHPVTGGFYEPDEAVIEAFRRWDANTHGSTADDRRARREADRRRREKREQDWKDRKLAELKEEADFLFRCQVPITDGVIGRPVKKAA